MTLRTDYDMCHKVLHLIHMKLLYTCFMQHTEKIDVGSQHKAQNFAHLAYKRF